MELDSKNLARLRRVADRRKMWTSECGDFTPWRLVGQARLDCGSTLVSNHCDC